MVDTDASTHRARPESAPPDIALQMVSSVALTMLGEVLGSSLTSKLLAGALGALLGAFLTERGSHHTRRIVAVALLLALLDALRGVASALASTVTTRGAGGSSRHHSGQGGVSGGSGTTGGPYRLRPADLVPRQPMLALAGAAASFVLGTGAVAAAHGLNNTQYAHLPNVVGQSASEATAILATDGFVAAIHSQRTLHGAGHRVLAQSPSPGESKPRGSTVALTVAAAPIGKVSGPVPNVVGLPIQQAIGRLEKSRFGTKLVRVASTAPTGQVLTQAPQPGAIATLGSVVSLAVSGGRQKPLLVTVPKLASLPAEVAETMLKAIDLSAIRVPESSEKVPSGSVIGSAPAAGVSVKKGTTVTLNVSSGSSSPSSETVPDLAGLPVEVAETKLKAIGLSASRVSESSEKVPSGLVISSSPAAGVAVEKGSTVTLSVSTGASESSEPAGRSITGKTSE